MSSAHYTLQDFVADLRTVCAGTIDMHDIFTHLKPLAVRFAGSADLKALCRKECDPLQGFDVQLLHEEPDHTLAVAVVSWLPGGGTPAHDHGTWGMVVGVEGEEVNVFWKRTDDQSRDGYAELERLSEKTFAPGQAIALTPSIIHSVRNDTEAISVSLHVYGKNVNFTRRSQFDPEKRTVAPYKIVQH